MKRRDIESRLTALGEIREIVVAMKNLSLIETHKLSRFIESQRRAVVTIERAAADFLHNRPDLLPSIQPEQVVFLVIGSERGFCGDYNERLIEAVEDHCLKLRCQARLLPVGSKLCSRLEGDGRVIQPLAGAAVAEEVPEVLQQVVEAIDRLERQQQAAAWFGLHHQNTDSPRLVPLLPPFQQLSITSPGVLHTYLEPGELFPQLVDHYLFALLNAIFFEALLAEHQRRTRHLAGAIDRLDESRHRLKVLRNRLRQEEITEEIETILLSAGAIEVEPTARRKTAIRSRFLQRPQAPARAPGR